MKSDEIFQGLKDLAEKMDINVSLQNFRNTGIPVQSGFCKIKNKRHCIIDKNLRIHKKIQVLAGCLAKMPVDDIYIVPAIRDVIHRNSKTE